MNLYGGIFAFAQATFPLLTALPGIMADLQPIIPITQIQNFYWKLSFYFGIVSVWGLLAILTDESNTQSRFIAGVSYIGLLLLSIWMSHQVAQWTMHELVTRATGWDEELSSQEATEGSMSQNLPKPRRKTVTSRQNGRRRR